jgi:MFS transporter, FSR family, fosmidomycin resistance protein
MNQPARFALGFASTGHALCHASKLVLYVSLAFAAADLGVGLVRMSLALTAFNLAMGVCSLPAGLLADRIGTSRVLIAYFWLLAVGGVVCATATSFEAFFAAHTLLGAAAGLYHPPGMALISHTAGRESMGPALGLHGVAGSLGIALMPALVAAGWRQAFLVLAILSAAAALAGHVLVRRRVLPGDEPPPAEGADGLLARRDLLLFLAVMSLNGFLLDGFTALFPQAVHAQSDGSSATALDTAILALGGVGQWLGGLLARGGRQGRRYVALAMLQPLLFLGMALALRGGFSSAIVLGFASFAFLNYGLQPMENRLLAAYTTSARRSAAYAVKFLLALVVGAGAPPLVIAVAERWEPAASFGVLCAVGVLGAALAASFRRAAGRSGGELGLTAPATPPPAAARPRSR